MMDGFARNGHSLFQSRYEIQAFRLESTAHGTGAPVDELQVEGVSSHSDLRKIFSSLASDSIEDSIFPTTFKKVDKILHEMKGKVGLGGPNPKHKVELSEDSSTHTRTKENGASSRIDVPDYGEEKNKVSNSSYNVNETMASA